jgi:predicted ATP-grasp superfamily ATP-dependent carboligase
VRGDARRRGEMMICGRDDRLLALAVSINMFPFLIKDVIRDVMKWNSTVNVRNEGELERMWGDRTGQEKGQAVMSYCA